ncbi:hypothetical protein YC2023_012376 [Brassica napus]
MNSLNHLIELVERCCIEYLRMDLQEGEVAILDYESAIKQRLKSWNDDGMHYRQPWVCAVEEELGFMKTRLEKCDEYKSLVVKLEVENHELKAEVEKLLARVSQLEYAHKVSS